MFQACPLCTTSHIRLHCASSWQASLSKPPLHPPIHAPDTPSSLGDNFQTNPSNSQVPVDKMK